MKIKELRLKAHIAIPGAINSTNIIKGVDMEMLGYGAGVMVRTKGKTIHIPASEVQYALVEETAPELAGKKVAKGAIG